MAAAPRAARRQDRRAGRGGLIAAYLLVVILIVASAAFVFGFEGGARPISEPAAAATSQPNAPVEVGSLAVPPRLVPLPAFRSFPPEELAGMIEVTAEGQRLPRISPSGWMPWIAHARRFDPSGPPARVGVLMVNLGANEAMMKRAIEALPSEVSLAFLPSTPDLPHWLGLAREHGHESYLMLPVADPNGPVERGIRPIETTVDPAENVSRLRAALARGEAYVGLVVPPSGPVAQSESTLRPLVKEIADRGLAVVEIDPTRASSVLQRLTAEMGVGYARTADVLDYKPANRGVEANLDRLVAWTADAAAEQPPRHAFGVVQPDDEAIDAIVTWSGRRAEWPAVSLVPIIGHFECRDACMARMRVQRAQLRP